MITAKQIQDEIYKTVDVIVREIIKSLPYCYIEEGRFTLQTDALTLY
jgi:hypothetical protein